MWFLFKILHVKGRNTCLCKGELCFILLGGVFTSLLLQELLLATCTLVLWPFLHTLCLSLIYIYIWCMSSSLISPCVVSFLSLYTYFFMYVILYFCFTLRCLDKFCLKCFRKIVCQSLSCHELSSYKFFQKFVLGLDFIVLNKWLWV